MAKRYDMQFKLDSVRYYEENKNLGIDQCAIDLGIASSTLRKWIKQYSCTKNNDAGEYGLKESVEIARLKKELITVKGELYILRKAVSIIFGNEYNLLVNE